MLMWLLLIFHYLSYSPLCRIFEGPNDLQSLILGNIPSSVTGPAAPTDDTVNTSPYYARLLAELAQQRGFDGYLLNVEGSFPVQDKQTGIQWAHALAAWVAILREELMKQVGPHSEAIWYERTYIL